MTTNEILKQALEQAVNERTEVRIKDVAAEHGIKHISSNDLRVMIGNLLRRHPEYRVVKIFDTAEELRRANTNPATASLFQYGVLTCCEYDDGKNF